MAHEAVFARVMDPRYLYRVTPRSVYDGDTVRVDIHLGFDVTLADQAIRLYGINTPEVRGDDREAGKAVRDIVRDLLLTEDPSHQFWMHSIKDGKGKYGRYLGILLLPDGTNLNAWLLDEGHAVPFMLSK